MRVTRRDPAITEMGHSTEWGGERVGAGRPRYASCRRLSDASALHAGRNTAACGGACYLSAWRTQDPGLHMRALSHQVTTKEEVPSEVY